jgi:hypothetical protein
MKSKFNDRSVFAVGQFKAELKQGAQTAKKIFKNPKFETYLYSC